MLDFEEKQIKLLEELLVAFDINRNKTCHTVIADLRDQYSHGKIGGTMWRNKLAKAFVKGWNTGTFQTP